jgi:phosphoglycerate dehydrogenase-like enzyme
MGPFSAGPIASRAVTSATEPLLVWLPFDPVELGGLPDGLRAEVYDGDVEPAGLDEVVCYVPPYMAPDHTVQICRRMPALQVVQTLTAGVDNVWPHLPAGATLCNARGVHDASTAELVVGLIIASLRRIPDFVRAQATGEWRYGRFDALADKRVLILGYGSVGEAIERRLAGFEVDIDRVARTARPAGASGPESPQVHGFDELAALLPAADVVVLITPLTEQTHGLVDAAFLARMKPGALLVNAARGPVVVTDDLLAAVRAGHVRAALDVTDPEPLPSDHPLWREPAVLISPHVGGNTTAFLPRAYRLVASQLRRFAAGEPLANVMARPDSVAP